MKCWNFSLPVKSAIKKISVFLPLNEADQSDQTGDSVLCSREKTNACKPNGWEFSQCFIVHHIPKLKPLWLVVWGKQPALSGSWGKMKGSRVHIFLGKSLCLETPNTCCRHPLFLKLSAHTFWDLLFHHCVIQILSVPALHLHSRVSLD